MCWPCSARGRLLYRLAAAYIAIFLIKGAWATWWPVWLASRLTDDGEVGWIMALANLVPVLAIPLIGQRVDTRGQGPNRPLRWLAWLTLLAFGLCLPAEGLLAVAGAIILVQVVWPALIPLTDTLTLAVIARQGGDYGRVRLWGSMAFIVAGATLGPLVEGWGVDPVLWWMIGAAGLLVLINGRLPPWPGAAEEPASRAPGESEEPGESTATSTGLWSVIRRPGVLPFLIAIALLQGSHCVLYTWGSLSWQRQGIEDRWIGLLWAVGVVAEILLFARSNRALARLGPRGLLMLAGVAGLIRWGAMTLTPSLPLLWALQALHGLTFGATWIGAMGWMARHATDWSARAQALHAATIGLALAGATAALTPMFEVAGVSAFGVAAGMALAGAVVAGVSIAPNKP